MSSSHNRAAGQLRVLKAPTGPRPTDPEPVGALTLGSPSVPHTAMSVGILSTYPPTQCGLATFAASLRASLMAGQPSVSVGIVRLGSTHQSYHDRDVAHVVSSDSAGASHDAADALNKFDVAIIQHEYGIYGGPDGSQVLDILELVKVPVVLVVHTVLADPTAHQRSILEMLVQAADAVVTMSETGRRRLIDDYWMQPRKLFLIPHGAPDTGPAKQWAGRRHRPLILTWGLLGPGKGIEWGISALASMSRMRPLPRYLVAGQTHPKVLAHEGERYRYSLAERAASHGVSDMVEFEPGFLSPGRLRDLLREADVVLLPYDSHEQITSGVLTEAIAAGVPVVSTTFPHGMELLADGKGGLLVPHKDPAAIAAALTKVLTDPGLAEAMSAHNASLTQLVKWPTVAGHYRQLLDSVLQQQFTTSR